MSAPFRQGLTMSLGKVEPETGGGRQAGGGQEIRQPPALQYRDQQLRHPRRAQPDGAQGRGVRGVRRQDRRGHHALGPDPDHPGRGQQGPQSAADRLPAPRDRLLRRQPAVLPAALSRAQHGELRPPSGPDARLCRADLRPLLPADPARGHDAAEHGPVPARGQHVPALSAGRWRCSSRLRPRRPGRARPRHRAADKPAGLDEEMRELRHRMESLQRQLDIMQKPRPPSE